MSRHILRQFFKKAIVDTQTGVGDPITITSVETLTPLSVSWGTLYSTLSLPALVGVNLSNGSAILLNTTWSEGTYDETTAGDYTLEGTLTLIPGVTNPLALKAEVDVTVANKLNITAVGNLSDVEVAEGILFADLQLPSTVLVTLSDTSIVSLGVTWSEGSYDEETPGTYTLSGTLTVPIQYTNIGGLTASIDVVVQEVLLNYVEEVLLALNGVEVDQDESDPIVARAGEALEFDVFTTGGIATLDFYDHDTGVLAQTKSGFTGAVTFPDAWKTYDLIITVEGLNTLPRHFDKCVRVLPPVPSVYDYHFDFDALMDARGSAFSNSATASVTNGSANVTTSAAHGISVGNWIRLKKVVYQAIAGTAGSTIVLNRVYDGITETVANNETKNFGAAAYNHAFNFNNIDTTDYPLVNLMNKNGVDSGVDVRERSDYKILVTGTLCGIWQIENLAGDLDDLTKPVHWVFDNAKIIATNSALPYAWQRNNVNINQLIDGCKTPGQFGLTLEGWNGAGVNAGQVLFTSGTFFRDMEFCGYKILGRRGEGAPNGGASFQVNPSVTAACNGNTWGVGHIYDHHFYIEKSQQENKYFLYFEDTDQANGPVVRCEDLRVWRGKLLSAGRDNLQFSSCDRVEASDITMFAPGLVAETGDLNTANAHNSAIAHNDGNKLVFVYRNTMKNCASWRSGQNGRYGSGNYFYYCNHGDQGVYPQQGTSYDPSQFSFNKIEFQDADFHDFNNTLISKTVDQAPICLQHDNLPTYRSLKYTMKANVFLSSGTNQTTPPGSIWLRRVGTPSDTTKWDVSSNIGQRVANEILLKLDAADNYKPNDQTSPIFNAGFDWSTRFGTADIPHTPLGGYYDLKGYSLNVPGVGRSAGCWSGQELYVIPDTTPPTLVSDDITNATSDGFRLDVTADGPCTVYAVVTANGAAQPTTDQIRLGNNASGVAALDAVNGFANPSVNLTITGLVGLNTTFDVWYFLEDSSGNRSSVINIEGTTSASGVAFVNAGAGAAALGSGANLSIPMPASLVAGNLLLMHIAGAGSTVVIGAQTGWNLIAETQISSSDSGTHATFWKISNGSETAHTATFTTDAGVVRSGRVYQFTGNHATTPIESASSGRANSATINDVGVTSTVNGAIAVNLIAVNDDNVVGPYTGQSGGTWSEPVEEFTTTTGNDACLAIQVAALPLAGTINGGTYVMAAADGYDVQGFVIKPA